jgi:hypothetical protein
VICSVHHVPSVSVGRRVTCPLSSCFLRSIVYHRVTSSGNRIYCRHWGGRTKIFKDGTVKLECYHLHRHFFRVFSNIRCAYQILRFDRSSNTPAQFVHHIQCRSNSTRGGRLEHFTPVSSSFALLYVITPSQHQQLPPLIPLITLRITLNTSRQFGQKRPPSNQMSAFVSRRHAASYRLTGGGGLAYHRIEREGGRQGARE